MWLFVFISKPALNFLSNTSFDDLKVCIRACMIIIINSIRVRISVMSNLFLFFCFISACYTTRTPWGRIQYFIITRYCKSRLSI